MTRALPPAAAVDLLDSVAHVVCGLDRSGRILAVNKACGRITGLTDVVGGDWCELFAGAERHDHVAALWASVTPDRPSTDFEALCGNGRRLRWHFSHWPHDGEAAVCAVGVDVTEERAQRARKRALERVTALANLSAGLAHELRNPLNSANLQLQLAERKLARLADPGSHPVTAQVSEALREIGRAAALLDDFLAFARPQQVALEQVELGAVVGRAVARVRHRATSHGVLLSVAEHPELITELAAAQVEAAVVQLLANAIDASAGARVREVMVRWRAEGNAAIVEVTDRGPGLPSESAPIFDPFFSTKPGGTGLGLAIVDRVVSDHGGVIEVERIDDTTVFRLRLPIVSGAL